MQAKHLKISWNWLLALICKHNSKSKNVQKLVPSKSFQKRLVLTFGTEVNWERPSSSCTRFDSPAPVSDANLGWNMDAPCQGETQSTFRHWLELIWPSQAPHSTQRNPNSESSVELRRKLFGIYQRHLELSTQMSNCSKTSKAASLIGRVCVLSLIEWHCRLKYWLFRWPQNLWDLPSVARKTTLKYWNHIKITG